MVRLERAVAIVVDGRGCQISLLKSVIVEVMGNLERGPVALGEIWRVALAQGVGACMGTLIQGIGQKRESQGTRIVMRRAAGVRG